MSMMFETIDLSAEGDLPDEVCVVCATRGLIHAESGTVLVYCIHTSSGAARSPGRPWNVVRGFTPEEFRKATATAIVANEVAQFERYLHGRDDGRKPH